MPRQVFVSHASANAEIALAICHGLESRGVSCWIAPRDVAFDGTYGTEIMKGLRECDIFLIVVTGAAAESQQVEREAERASHYKKRIIPVIVGDSEPGPRLEFYVAGRQQFPCPSAPDERFLGNLAQAIRQGPGSEQPAARSGSEAATPGARDVSASRNPDTRQGSNTRAPLWMVAMAAVLVLAVITALYFSNRPSTEQGGTPVQPSSPAPQPAASTPPPAAAPAQPRADSGRPRGGSPSQPPVVPSSNPGGTPIAAATRETRDGRGTGASSPSPDASSPAAAPSARGGAPANVNGVSLRFVALPGGTVRMGCADGDTACADDEKRGQRVSVDPFQISATEVTQDFWQAVTGRNPSDFEGPGRPVEHVSWQDAQDFADRLTQKGDGFRYRLPSEAEWEYAARANETTLPDLASVAWFGLTQSIGRQPRPQTVATKMPNKWGLYDMLGNVAEWCEDWYSPGALRVVKGGAWDDPPTAVRPSARGKAIPGTREYNIGVRLVREPR